MGVITPVVSLSSTPGKNTSDAVAFAVDVPESPEISGSAIAGTEVFESDGGSCSAGSGVLAAGDVAAVFVATTIAVKVSTTVGDSMASANCVAVTAGPGVTIRLSRTHSIVPTPSRTKPATITLIVNISAVRSRSFAVGWTGCNSKGLSGVGFGGGGSR